MAGVGRGLIVRILLIAGIIQISMMSSSFAVYVTQTNALHVWSNQASSISERYNAVSILFTNGTPILYVVEILGTNYRTFRPISSVAIDISQKQGNRIQAPETNCSIHYYFGKSYIAIHTTADIGDNPLKGRLKSIGKGEPQD